MRPWHSFARKQCAACTCPSSGSALEKRGHNHKHVCAVARGATQHQPYQNNYGYQ